MEKAAEYYDLPTEWIPSANFAGRPLSEISEANFMDAFSTLLHGDTSLSNTGDESVQQPHSPVHPLQLEPSAWIAPSITTTAPTDDMWAKSLTRGDETAERPPMRRKAATTPPGGISPPKYKPQPPRRAISARMGSANMIKRHKQEESVVEDPVPLDDGRGDLNVTTPQQLAPPKRPPTPDNDQLTQEAKQAGSFSQKARVRKTLRDKSIAQLKTDIVDFELRGWLSSPTSMMSTPRELYAIPEQTSEANLTHGRQSETVDTTKSRNAPTSVQSDDRGWAGHRVYLPGQIRLEEHPAKIRGDSLATLDPFERSTEPSEKRFSDIIGIEKITMYFEGLGVLEEVTSACLDRYWLDESPPAPQAADARKPGAPGIEEQGATGPQKSSASSSPPGSRFSFSSTSSTASSQPPLETPMRQRDRLRRLLSPGLPGSAFKISGNWAH
jgi:hypothetical protein